MDSAPWTAPVRSKIPALSRVGGLHSLTCKNVSVFFLNNCFSERISVICFNEVVQQVHVPAEKHHS